MSGLRLVLEPPLARLVLDCPERRNAMNRAMWGELPEICAEIEARFDVGAVIVEGAGGHFCSGADITEFDEIFDDLSSARAYLGSIERALEALAALDRPTLAQLEGSVVGGGLAIALACDLRFAADDALFAVPPAKLGLLYGPAETRLLVETVGPATAKDLLFSGRSIDTQEAIRLGLIHGKYPAGDLVESTRTQARRWTKLSETSIRGAKRAVRAALAANVAELRALVEAAAMGPDFRVGRAAFKAKRPPKFKTDA